MGSKLNELKEKLGTISDISAATAVLSWDQETYMPSGSAAARAKQLATLQRLAHDSFTSEEMGTLIEHAKVELNGDGPDSDDVRLMSVVSRDYERQTKLPSSLVSEMAEASSAAKQAWKKAYHESDFDSFKPLLARNVELKIKQAEAFGYTDNIYDPLLDQFEPGMSTAHVSQIFSDLKPKLIALVKQIAERDQPQDEFLHIDYDEQTQIAFGEKVIRDFGFDFDRGRQDLAHHPFATAFAISDVRITTRVWKNYLPACLFGTLHECGHALYEQGIGENLERTILADGTSLGVHESQSRMYENLVGRSKGFWEHYYSDLQSTFPDQLSNVELGTFYKAINKVKPSMIRVEADEVTYNLHIMLRFELETELLAGKIKVDDLPELWSAKMQEYLGVTPTNDTEGVLQDIHWSMGAIGYFSTYALGNLMSTQFFDQAKKEIPSLDEKIRSGQYLELREWLREKIHVHGRKFNANELLERVTGSPLQADSYLAYIHSKYGEIYGNLDA